MPCFNLGEERVVGLFPALLSERGYIGGAVVHVRMAVRVEFFPHEIFEYGHGIDAPALGGLGDQSFLVQIEQQRPPPFSFSLPCHGVLLLIMRISSVLSTVSRQGASVL